MEARQYREMQRQERKLVREREWRGKMWFCELQGLQKMCENDLLKEAFETSKLKQVAGVKPNSTTVAIIVPAAAPVSILEQGMDIQ